MKHLLHFTKKIHEYAGKTLYFNMTCMMFIGLLESVGIFLIIPLIGLTGIVEFSTDEVSFLGWMNGLFSGLSNTLSLVIILGVYVLLMVGQAVFKRSQTILGAKIQHGFTRHLREEAYRNLLQSNWQFYLRKRKSDIINIMSSEVFHVSAGVQLFLTFVSSLIFTFIQICLAFYLSVTMTTFILVFGLILILLLRSITNRSQELGKEGYELSKTYLAGMTDHFNGIKDIKSNSLEDVHLKWFLSLSERMEQNRIALTSLKTSSQLIFKVVSSVLIAIFVFFAIKMFTAQPAQVMLIMVIFSRLWPRITGIQSNLEQLGAIVPSFKGMLDLQKECLDAKELDHLDYMNVEPLELKQGLYCHHVFFQYQGSDEYALKDITASIPANRMTAIVGRSGAGKSTLIDLLMGLNVPDRGWVTVDGVPLSSEQLLSLRRTISYIPQDPFLFNATIRENLMIIEPNARDESIWEALEFAAAADFVRELPQGLDTLIGDRGIRLSGGERQRLVLARAILRKPSILVLDEATSALDTENEVKIQHAIDRLKGKMTIIVIAHRLSTIRNADQVLVLDQGEIIQTGEYHMLKETQGVFKNLVEVQMR